MSQNLSSAAVVIGALTANRFVKILSVAIVTSVFSALSLVRKMSSTANDRWWVNVI